jgi:hypothetical protein
MRRPLLVALLMCCAPALAQNNMPGTDMSRHDAPKPDKEMQDMKDMEGMHEMPSMDGGSASAIHSMEGHHLDMGPHMKMTSLRAPKPGDQEKAAQVVQASRAVANKYQDYKVALADGYKIFLPSCRKSSITSPIIGMHSKRESISTHPIPRRCCTKGMATITSSSA